MALNWTPKHEVEIAYTDQMAITCAISNGPTPVRINITYVPTDKIYDLDKLHQKLIEMSKERKWLIEEFAVAIFEHLDEELAPDYLEVKVCGKGPNHPWACATVKD